MASSVSVNEAASGQQPTTREPKSHATGFDFLDLRTQFASIREEVMQAVTRVMESQHFILGNEVRAFEEEFSSAFDAEHAVSCASGSDALVLALMAAGVGNGDEVITSPFTFVATAGSIARVGAKPVFVDIDSLTYNMDPSKVEAAITQRTRAIMPVHLFGLSADLAPIVDLAGARGLVIVEDAAQAVGAQYRGSFVGNIGDFGCFSFFPSKNLGGAGDGGLVTARDGRAAERLRLLRVHGSSKKYHHDILGTNSRLDALQAAILRVKLRHLENWTTARQQRAQRYRELFQEMELGLYVKLPPEPSAEYRHVYNQFTIRCSERGALREYLRESGIPTEIYYPVPLHLQPAFAYLGGREGQFPEAELAAKEVLALPVYPELSELQQETVVVAIADFFKSRKQSHPDLARNLDT